MGKLSLNQLFQIPTESVENQKGKIFVGIDFGTSTTVVSVASYNTKSKHVECSTLHLIQKEADGNIVEAELMPSVIAINSDGSPLVGEGAYKLKGKPDYVFGENLWHSFKMELGKNLGPIWYKSQQPTIKSPQDASRFFFKQLKRCIEKACPNSDIHYAVSIPASFESNQRKDLLDALEANGLITNIIPKFLCSTLVLAPVISQYWKSVQTIKAITRVIFPYHNLQNLAVTTLTDI